MKYFFILLTVFVSPSAIAQSGEDSVKATINKMFTGMKNADASLLRNSFADSAVLQTIIQSKEGKIALRNEDVKEFVDFVSKQSAGDADERITFETIGPLAIAWTPYHFYYKKQFSHCGVNSFQSVRLNGEWKIQYIIDTRRKQPCKN